MVRACDGHRQDLIETRIGKPANFLDVGVPALPASGVAATFQLMPGKSQHACVLVNIFGGIIARFHDRKSPGA